MPSAAELIGLGEAPKLAGCIGNVVSTKAGIGTTQAGAAPITTNFTILTPAGGALAYLLPTVPAGSGPYFMSNMTATPASIFPPVGGTIQGAAANIVFSIATLKTAAFYKTTATAWVAILSA
jgi:hypothetical protein